MRVARAIGSPAYNGKGRNAAHTQHGNPLLHDSGPAPPPPVHGMHFSVGHPSTRHVPLPSHAAFNRQVQALKCARATPVCRWHNLATRRMCVCVCATHLLAHAVHEVRPGHALGEAREVFDLGSAHELTSAPIA